jgi:hypothetical protein
MPERKAPNKYGNPGDQAIEEVECAHSPDADEIKERPLDAEVCEGLVQAFVAPVAPPDYGVCLHSRPSQLKKWLVGDLEHAKGSAYTPHSQVRTLVASTAIPVPAATPARVFLAPGSPCANW